MKKFLSVLLTLALVANLTAIVFVNAVATESQQTKVFNFLDSYTAEELAELTADPDDYYVSVFVEFAYPEMDIDGLDELDRPSRNAAIRNYHMMQNLAIATQLGIPADAISSYAPYAELRYESIAAYEAAEDFVYSLGESEDIQDVEVSVFKIENQDLRATADVTALYPISQVHEDIGISENDYMGEGIKIGILDVYFPNSYAYVPNSKRIMCDPLNAHTDPLYCGSHASYISALISSPVGVASETTFCYTSVGYYGFQNSIDALINQNVDIINMSMRLLPWSSYDNHCAYVDYLIHTTGTALMKSAGNTGNDLEDDDETNDAYTGYMFSPSASANAVTVGATNCFKQVSYFSSYINQENSVLKPDLVAPGENLSQVGAYGSIGSGTSYSTPLVTGIAARLMDEFPILLNNPRLLKAVLLASCVRLPDQGPGHNQYAGAGLVNYSRARTIMINQQYDYIDKYTDADYDYIGYIQLPNAPVDHTINLWYVVPVPVSAPTIVNMNPHPVVFTQYRFYVYETNTHVVQSYVNNQNTGYLPCPNDPFGSKDYIVEVYVEGNYLPDATERIYFAYMIDMPV